MTYHPWQAPPSARHRNRDVSNPRRARAGLAYVVDLARSNRQSTGNVARFLLNLQLSITHIYVSKCWQCMHFDRCWTALEAAAAPAPGRPGADDEATAVGRLAVAPAQPEKDRAEDEEGGQRRDQQDRPHQPVPQ